MTTGTAARAPGTAASGPIETGAHGRGPRTAPVKRPAPMRGQISCEDIESAATVRGNVVPLPVFPCPGVKPDGPEKIASRPVSRVLYGPDARARRNVAAIPLGPTLPSTSCNLPERPSRRRPEGRPSRRSYSVLLPVGFAVPFLLPGTRWALTPPFHPGPRTRRGWTAFCGTFPGVSPAGRYPAPCLRGARTFLTNGLSTLVRAAARPAGTSV